MSTFIQNPYNGFLQVKSSLTLPAKNSNDNQNKINNSQPIASVSLNEEEKKHSGNLTKVVAGGAIVAAAIGVLFARGGSGKLFKNVNSYIQKVNDKIAEYTKRKNSLSVFEKMSLSFNKKMQKVLEYVNVGNNLTAVKDAGFQKLCEKLHLRKTCDWITNQFKKITIFSSQKSYQKARNALDSNIPLLKQMEKHIKNPEDLKKFKEILSSMEKDILGVTSGAQRLERLAETEKATANVGKKVEEELGSFFRALFKRDGTLKEQATKFRIYRTEVHAATGKEKLKSSLQSSQRKFTFNIDDKTDIMSSAKDEISRILKIEDTTSRDLLKDISKYIQEYKKCAGANEASERQKVVAKLQTAMDKLKTSVSLNNKYSPESQTFLKTQFKEIDSILTTTDKKGSVEELLGILNRNLKQDNPEIYTKATRLTKQMRHAVKKAFDNEIKLYDKFAEYNVGSAPTDVLGMMLPLGVAAYSISKGENKDERVSATLNAGIPIVGGVATTILAAAKMMTNAQGLILGALAGLGLNAIGAKADQNYKEWNDNKVYIAKALEAYKASNNA